MQLNTGQWVVVIIAGVLILSFILGYYSNRQRAEKIFRWLKQGLSKFGEVSFGSKLPGMTTGGRLEVNQAASPFRRIEAVYLLAPRENPLFLIFHLLQRRGDELIVWVNYLSKPGQSVEVARPGDRQFAKRLLEKDRPPLPLVENVSGLQIAAEAVAGSAMAGRVQAFIAKYPSNIIRLALRPDKPHLYLRTNLRIMQRTSAADLLEDLKQFML